MSAEALRKSVIDQIEKLNADAMTHACGVRPNLQTSADGIALTVVDQLAMARAFATCVQIINLEFRKLMTPQNAPQTEKSKVRDVY